MVHKKVDEVMQQTTKTPNQTGNKQSLDQLDLDLDLSSDEDPGESEMSQGDIRGDEEALESEFNREDYTVDNIEVEKDEKEKDSRKRLRVSSKDWSRSH